MVSCLMTSWAEREGGGQERLHGPDRIGMRGRRIPDSGPAREAGIARCERPTCLGVDEVAVEALEESAAGPVQRPRLHDSRRQVGAVEGMVGPGVLYEP